MQRVKIHFSIALVLLALSLSGCGLFRAQEKPEVELAEIFPEALSPVGRARRFDLVDNGTKEWLVFYHVDLVEKNLKGSPTVAAVYRPEENPDSRLPPVLVPELLWLPSQGYLCLYECDAEMRDVIGGDPRAEELVILDKRDKETVGVAIFRWRKDLKVEGKQGEGGFVPLGHFRGDKIEIELDEAKVIRRLDDRSDLATQELYKPAAGRYYSREVRHVDDPFGQLLPPREAEIIFWAGLPKEPSEVKLPEKLVLAFYQNFTKLAEIEKYVEPGTWVGMGRTCGENVCGCASRHRDVSRVMVKQMAYEADKRSTVNVVVQVVCVDKKNQKETSTTLTWSLNRQSNGTWRLAGVTPGGDGYLTP